MQSNVFNNCIILIIVGLEKLPKFCINYCVLISHIIFKSSVSMFMKDITAKFFHNIDQIII